MPGHLNISKFTVVQSTVSVPLTADPAQLEALLKKRIRELEHHIGTLQYELLIVQGKV